MYMLWGELEGRGRGRGGGGGVGRGRAEGSVVKQNYFLLFSAVACAADGSERERNRGCLQ